MARNGILRTLIAFLVAPLVVPIAFLLPLLAADRSAHFSIVGAFGVILMFGIYAIPLAYLTELILGLPAWFIFKHYGIRSIPAFAAGGAFLGLLFYLIMEAVVGNFIRYPIGREFNPFASTYLNIDVVAGCAAATLFRAIVFSRKTEDLRTNRHSGAGNHT